MSHEMCLGRLATTTLTVHSHISRRGRGTEDVHLHMQANLANCCCCCCGVCGWTAQCHPCCLCHPGVWRHQRHRPGSEFPLQLPASSRGSRSHRGAACGTKEKRHGGRRRVGCAFGGDRGVPEQQRCCWLAAVLGPPLLRGPCRPPSGPPVLSPGVYGCPANASSIAGAAVIFGPCVLS